MLGGGATLCVDARMDLDRSCRERRILKLQRSEQLCIERSAACALSGTLPNELSGLNLYLFWVANGQVSGSVPRLNQTGRLVSVRTKNLKLSGTIGSVFASASPVLLDFQMDSNSISGTTPANLSSPVLIYRMDANDLSGTIANTLIHRSTNSTISSALGVFGEDRNMITDLVGTVLTTDKEASLFAVFNLGQNKISGTIPDTSKMYLMSQLALNDNDLSGSLPTTLYNKSYMYLLALGENQISGSISISICTFSSLQYLFVGGMALSATIPSEMSQLPLLNLDLSRQKISGSSSPEFSNWKDMTLLSISENNQMVSK